MKKYMMPMLPRKKDFEGDGLVTGVIASDGFIVNAKKTKDL